MKITTYKKVVCIGRRVKDLSELFYFFLFECVFTLQIDVIITMLQPTPMANNPMSATFTCRIIHAGRILASFDFTNITVIH